MREAYVRCSLRCLRRCGLADASGLGGLANRDLLGLGRFRNFAFQLDLEDTVGQVCPANRDMVGQLETALEPAGVRIPTASAVDYEVSSTGVERPSGGL